MTREETDKIAARIRKMLALSRDAAATEGERDNALRMAHATLAKYNLDMAECEAAGGTVDETRDVDRTPGGNSAIWAKTIANSCAKLFFCSFFTSGKTYCYVGRTSNIATAKAMTAYLIESIGKEAVRQTRANYWTRRDSGNFRRAAAAAIYWRVLKMIKEASAPAATASTSTALVLSNVYASESTANALVIQQKVGKLSSGSSLRIGNGSAANAGRAFGSGVSLNQQIGGGTRKALR